MRTESQVKRARMSNITIRVPDELMDRVRAKAARDYSKEAAVLRRVIRLGLDADDRLEGTTASSPREPAEAAVR
jgi:hypothetical protein